MMPRRRVPQGLEEKKFRHLSNIINRSPETAVSFFIMNGCMDGLSTKRGYFWIEDPPGDGRENVNLIACNSKAIDRNGGTEVYTLH